MNKKNENLVSVIMPCFNHENYVGAAIESIANQSYGRIELVLIDDGSTDRTYEVALDKITKFKNRFENIFHMKRDNKGLCATLNEAITYASGNYIALQASDDISENSRIKRSVELAKDKQCDVVCGQIEIIDLFSAFRKKLVIKPGYHNFKDIATLRHLPAAPTALIKREIFEKVGLFKEDALLEDFYMWLKILSNGGVIYTDMYLYSKYRKHKDNLSSNYEILHQARVNILSEYKLDPIYFEAIYESYYSCAIGAAGHSLPKTLKYLFKSKKIIQVKTVKVLFKALFYSTKRFLKFSNYNE